MARPRKSTPIALSVDARRFAEDIAAYLLELVGERLNEREGESPPLLLTVGAISKRTGLGQTFIKGEIRAGRLRARKAGDRTVVTPEAFGSWVETLRPVAPTMGKPQGELPRPSRISSPRVGRD
jgi:hypothetical protein